MGIRDWLKPRVQELAMSSLAKLRPSAVSEAQGDVLEIGFGTGLNIEHYGAGVERLWGLDPMSTAGVRKVDRRIEAAPFPVERVTLRADGTLPFETDRFDCVVTTWTLCSIPDPDAALGEMRRVLKPDGLYLFLEHGKSRDARVWRWQDRINPAWRCFADGCNMNRQIDELITRNGFALRSLDEFLGKGPRLLSTMYRGVGLKA